MIERNIPRDWLNKRLICRLKEEKNAYERNREILDIAEGFSNLRDEWEEVFGDIGPTDEVWEFDTPDDYWISLCGRAGLALVRVGSPICGIVTEMN